MGRYPFAPYDFTCVYEHTCPYLEDLSTKWVYSEYRRSQENYQEDLRIIDAFREAVDEQDKKIRALERELAEVRAKYQALHRRQFKANRRRDETMNDGRLMTGASCKARRPKKRGAPVGHPPWTRPIPTRIDLTVSVPAPTTCPHCGSGALEPEGTLHEHLQEDIVLAPRTVVTKFVHEEAYCPCCRRSVVAAGPNEIPKSPHRTGCQVHGRVAALPYRHFLPEDTADLGGVIRARFPSNPRKISGLSWPVLSRSICSPFCAFPVCRPRIIMPSSRFGIW